ncbi:HK97-gp10 family putative phage morphogenesis protein [Pseudomonas putida]|uniref:Phage protein, HK97 gp10 family n=1 Tax=Pseudomonas putida TaxID=303 RepID=A0A1X0ZT22_PSEPU|nr:HK97-gp10 family putative phage morphogenesis protein [Pseudomonas putida]ORL62905.1 hypothetical protein B7H17_16250 [Pseudomonas putida]
MPDYVEFKLKGADDIAAKFRSLSEGVRRQVALPAAKDAMDIVRQDAEERAWRIDNPKTDPTIALNIVMQERKKLDAEMGAVMVSVGVKGYGVRKGGPTFYWKFVELGTEHSRARPFLRPALEQNRAQIFREFLSSARYQLIRLGEF